MFHSFPLILMASFTVLIFMLGGSYGFVTRSAVVAPRLQQQRRQQQQQRQQDSAKSLLLLLSAITPITKTDEEWKQELPPNVYEILRREGTEPPNTSELNFINKDQEGIFVCAGCGAPLFTPDTKFDSGTGWPSFYAPIDQEAIALSTDYKLILPRTECKCATCGGHLGHVFGDGPEPSGQRFCMNGLAMKFVETATSSSQDNNAKNNDNNIDNDASDALKQTVLQRQQQNPYKPDAKAAIPGIVFNALIGCLCFASFTDRMETTGSIGLFDVIPLLPALFYGSMAVQGIKRIL